MAKGTMRRLNDRWTDWALSGGFLTSRRGVARRLEPLERRLAVIENRSAEHQVEALARAVESAIDGVLLSHKGRGMSSEMLNRLSDA